MRRPPVPLAFALAACLFTIAPARAEWPQSKTVQIGVDGNYYGCQGGRFLPDPSGDGFYPLIGTRSHSNVWVWGVSRVTLDGDPAWSGGIRGMNYDYLPGPQDDLRGQVLVPVGGGRTICLWGFEGTKACLFMDVGDPAGTFPPQVLNGYGASDTLADLSNNYYLMPYGACGRDGGGAFVAWHASGGLRLQRIDDQGHRDPAWPRTGWNSGLPSSYSLDLRLALTPDGNGGVFVLACGYDANSGTYYPVVQRFTDAMSVAPGWPAAGLVLPHSVLAVPQSFRLVRSDASHYFAVWEAQGDTDVLTAMRFTSGGTLDPAWPSGGIALATISTTPASLTCVEDGAGGMTVGWYVDAFQLRHIRADGSTPGRYAAGPWTPVLEDRPSYIMSAVALARGLGDGACIVYGCPGGIRARWLDGEGQPVGCDPGEECFVQLQDEGMVGAALADGAGGVYYVWQIGATGAGDTLCPVYVSHADYLGIATTAVAPPQPRATPALSVSPNPARGPVDVEFTLADDRDARLELLDLAGRRVRALDVRGARAHRERFDDLGALAPGVYLVRLVHGGESRWARVVLVR